MKSDTADRGKVEPRQTPDLMTVSEVADYLRVRERTIYELVRTQRIPSCKLSGKLLFPKRLIELWVAQSADYPHAAAHLASPPPVIAGSHDPLLDWTVRESRCGLALMVGGSADGLTRFLAGQAVACALHLIDPLTGEYDASVLRKTLPGVDFVVIEWARRRQGLIVARGNPRKIASVHDLTRDGIRLAVRQPGSGSGILLAKLMTDAGLSADDVAAAGRPATSETDVAHMIRDGNADAGLAIEAAARELVLDFVPLTTERFDLAMRRTDYFEPPLQTLLEFARAAEFRARADALGGYDVSANGSVVYNAHP